MESQVVVFQIGEKNYGLDVQSVESIARIQIIKTYPELPDFIEGFIDLHGKAMPVIDMRKYFAIPPIEKKEARETRRLMVIAIKGCGEVALIVDSVSDVIVYSKENIDPPSASANDLPKVTAGTISMGNYQVRILNMENVITPKDRSDLATIIAQQSGNEQPEHDYEMAGVTTGQYYGDSRWSTAKPKGKG